jgi:hypothetical protein
MQLPQLPVSEAIGVAKNEEDLIRLFEEIFGSEPVYYYEPVHGAPCSIRIFSTSPTESSVWLGNQLGMNAFSLAIELLEFDSKARRISSPHTSAHTAWEIRTASHPFPLQEKPVRRAIALATWEA